MVVPQRLSRAARRAQILCHGADHFAARPFEQVQMDEIAASAGISRALLYQHFTSKRDLFAGVYQEAADGLLERTRLDPSAPLEPQVVAGLDAHIDYFVANRNAVLAANRTLAGDPVIATIIATEMDVLRQRLLEFPALQHQSADFAAAVLMSWLVFVRVLCVEWLASGTGSRQQLRDICVGALLGALGALHPREPS